MRFEAGSIVRVRDREWIVQAESTDDLLQLVPLGGTEKDMVGVYTPLEKVESASFSLPDPSLPGDWVSCRLLQDAMLLGFRNSAGPFRSFGHLEVDPRAYQFVPLILAMRMDPIRMLIADDVGIGKTVEALLIARELLDRGEADGVTVICPPHLAEQWQQEMSTKFHIHAELVLSSTAARLERDIGYDKSLFDIYPNTIVSLDYIKHPRRRDEFRRACRNLVIVDEAHTCTKGDEQFSSSRQQRYELLQALSQDPDRHILLLTATPHSGKEANFRSLLVLLDKSFSDMPSDLRGDSNQANRRKLAVHFVQRRRADIKEYLMKELGGEESSPFPDRLTQEVTYSMSPAYRSLLNSALAWARDTAGAEEWGAKTFRSRVQWWSALALLRACSSSPAAAVATLENRTEYDELLNAETIDEIGKAEVFDGQYETDTSFTDSTPGAPVDGQLDNRHARALREMKTQAKALIGAQDPKMMQLVPHIESLLKEGFSPIIFCRFIDTAVYLAHELRSRLPSALKAEVQAVTGQLAPQERKERIKHLGTYPVRVLVATDCLSEGINLQEYFDAVVHYDLSWNPTRHEQREGRADRFGQKSPVVKTITYYGRDNPVDGIIINTLLRKHESIRASLGISVPIPMDSNAVAEAIMESLLMKEYNLTGEQMIFEEVLMSGVDLEGVWKDAAEREKASRALFAQHAVPVSEVRDIWQKSVHALGSDRMMSFLRNTFMMNSVPSGQTHSGALEVDLASAEARKTRFDRLNGKPGKILLQQKFPVRKGETYIMRTHPFVAGLAELVFTDALDKNPMLAARRCGVVVTDAVRWRTLFFLLRARFIIRDYKGRQKINEKMAEDCLLAAYRDDGYQLTRLPQDETERLIGIVPSANMPAGIQKIQLANALSELSALTSSMEEIAKDMAVRLQKEHRSVRSASRLPARTEVDWVRGGAYPLDVVGVYVFMPSAGRK